jgi:hypothetical protein
VLEEESRVGEIEALPDGLIAGLARADAYPDDPSAQNGVEHVQTHISHVFLTGARVYKLRKAVDLGFVHFGTRAERDADCLREVALNRRFSPDVYLGVAPVSVAGGRARVGALAETLAAPAGFGAPHEHCVVMRRLPAGRDALALLAAGRLRARHIDAVAEVIARAHEAHRLGTPAPFGRDEWMVRITGPVEGNFESLDRSPAGVLSRRQAERVRDRARAFVAAHADRFESRRLAGLAVDGHGDLHLAHVWFERDDVPLLVDCIEFREDFRRIDAASDVAFFAMDLAYRGRAGLARRFLRRYARATDDFDLYRVLDYYLAYRAAVRAKVAALAARDEAIAPAQRAAAATSARRHLALAARALAPRGPGALVLVAGVVGTGKSSAAEVVADALGGAVIASDRVRKRQAGIAPTERVTGAAQRALYSAQASARAYAGLFERAAALLDGGRAAILDATFSRADERKRALAFAAERGAPALLVETRCPDAIVRERLARRAAANTDVSDAGPELLAQSAAWFEPVVEWPGHARIVAASDAPGWRTRLAREPALRALTARVRGGVA